MERSACKDARPVPRPELSVQAGPGKAARPMSAGQAKAGQGGQAKAVSSEGSEAARPDRKFIHRFPPKGP